MIIFVPFSLFLSLSHTHTRSYMDEMPGPKGLRGSNVVSGSELIRVAWAASWSSPKNVGLEILKYWLENFAHTSAHTVNPISMRESVCLPRELGQIIQFVRFENDVWIANLWRTFPVEKRERELACAREREREGERHNLVFKILIWGAETGELK